MQCKQCLHELAEGSRFCTECGCPAPDPQETVAPAEPPVEAVAPVTEAATAPAVEPQPPVMEAPVAAAGALQCKQCLHELAEGMKFCTECGHPVGDPPDAVAPAPIVVEAPVAAAPEVRAPVAPSAPPVAPRRGTANALMSPGYRVSVGAFVLLIAIALAAVFGLRWYGGSSKNPVVVSTGLKAGPSAAAEKAAGSASIGAPKAGATVTPPPNPNDAAKVPNGAVTADQDSAPVATVPDDETAAQRGHESSGDGSEELVGTFKQSERRDAGGHTVREAATVYVVRCNGRRLYIYEYVNRGGFRAIRPPDSRPIGGHDFETYEDAVQFACE